MHDVDPLARHGMADHSEARMACVACEVCPAGSPVREVSRKMSSLTGF